VNVRVLTDSTACLPAALVAAAGVTVLPMPVTIDGVVHETGCAAEEVLAALQQRSAVTTSRIAPHRFGQAYAQLAGQGARAVVSVHLSGHLSGTADSARTAAVDAPIPVTVVDTATVAMAVGFSALAAAEQARGGAEPAAVAEAATQTARASALWFAVRDLAHLRRGGRITAGQALVGTALHVLPILGLEAGRLVPVDRVRTTRAAQRRLVELAQGHAARLGGAVDIALLDSPPGEGSAQARGPVPELRELLSGLPVDRIVEAPIDSVLAAHTGPGTFALIIAPARSG